VVSFEGQVAIVTGAGRGLGRAYARELARLGAKVVVNDPGAAVGGEGSDKGPAEQVCREIRAAGGEAVPNLDSVASFAGGAGIVKTAVDTWGRVDAVVCNAGILRDKAFHNQSEDDWDQVIAVHLKGCFSVLHAAWPHFRSQRYGRVVLCTSSTGLFGNFGQSNYGAAKAGMIGLMNTLKLEGEKYDIRVNTIGPSAYTRMTEGLMSDEQNAKLTPEHVAPVVALLASRDCPDSGVILEALGGRISRTAIVRGRGVEYDADKPRDPDWIAAHWDRITSLEGGQLMWSLGESLERHRSRG
jgi:NAD(P)-dependent dehydrogenase (short-subunit alcohol dehydrogenase family)